MVTYGCESWTVKKAECQRIDAFKLWCWRRLLKFPWTARTSNHSILREINPEYSLEGLMLKLKLQYFGHLMWTDVSWFWERSRAKEEGLRGWDGWMASRWNEHELGQTPEDGERWGMLQSMGSQRVGHKWLTEQQQHRGFPGGARGKEPACQCRRCKRCRFDPWVWKIPWRRSWQPTPVFLSGESPRTEEPGELQRVRHNWSNLACMQAQYES